ncbi:MAG: YcbK family protein [Proteobacteria bacterium]|nr:YcbK family protein [Pseudomonadota bacterium]
MLSRRQFLQSTSAAGFTALATPALAIGDFDLHIIRQRTNETFRGDVVRNGLFKQRVDNKALQRLNHLMRDLRADVTHEMDLDLIQLIGRIQRHIPDQPVLVTSAFRTPATNRAIRGSARGSLHMQGKAIDMRVPGFSTRKLREIARAESDGGVGWYPRRNFIHVDTGERRDWRR